MEPPDPVVELAVDAYLPDTYIRDPGQKVEDLQEGCSPPEPGRSGRPGGRDEGRVWPVTRARGESSGNGAREDPGKTFGHKCHHHAERGTLSPASCPGFRGMRNASPHSWSVSAAKSGTNRERPPVIRWPRAQALVKTGRVGRLWEAAKRDLQISAGRGDHRETRGIFIPGGVS